MMIESEFKLKNPPIVEAVLDIECDLPAGQKLGSLEPTALQAFATQYPKFRKLFMQEHRVETPAGEPPNVSVRHGVQALQFLHEDEKQLVQIRVQGFSFNRLYPYTSLDDYLPEIERVWQQYIKLASPVQLRLIRLRYINRILLPSKSAPVELNDYFRLGPRLPDEKNFTLVNFLNQYSAMELATGHLATTVLTSQDSDAENSVIIFDNAVAAVPAPERRNPQNWSCILNKIQVLRNLKNRMFKDTLTEKCIALFR